jgi:hypothetical protein
MIVFQTSRKDAPVRDVRLRHIDEWQALADRKRDDALGVNFFEDIRTFFHLADPQMAPRFRPSISIPELQILCMKEGNDLSEFSPVTYIYNSKGSQDDFQKSFKAQWQSMKVPYHLLFSFVASQFQGTGFLYFGIDPFARNGKGRMWTKWLNSRQVHLDPNADYTCNWSFAIIDEYVHLDEIKRRFPEKAHLLPKVSSNAPADGRGEQSQSGFQTPPGPWEAMPPFQGLSGSARGGASRLRTCIFKDYSRSVDGGIPPDPKDTKYKWLYPRGRIIMDAEDVVLADGAMPLRRVPLFPIWATPPLYGTWAVPPMKYTKSLQDLAERTYSQTFENFYRMNNGVWFIPAGSGIELGKFGGIPGEREVYEGDKPPTCVTPPAFPESSLKFPEQLLQKQRDLHGYNQARQGDPGSGNLSVDLFDAAVLRGQSMTQLRGRLASAAIEDFSELVVLTMLEYMPEQRMLWKDGGKVEEIKYRPPNRDEIDDMELLIDAGSFHVKSQAAIGKIAEQLMARGIIPPGEGLEMIGYPDAEKVQKRIDESQALAAVTAVSTGSGGKGKK